MSNIKTYDNTLSEELFSEITKSVFSYDFPWYYSGTAYTKDTKPSIFGYSYAHTALMDGNNNSSICELLLFAIKESMEKIGQDPNVVSVTRIRIGNILASKKTFLHPAHVDYTQPHNTGLIYLNDSDGDTYIYNEKYDPTLGTTDFEQYSKIKDNLTIKDRITPRANRFVWFDGLHFHNSSTPTKVDRRIVINFNYNIL